MAKVLFFVRKIYNKVQRDTIMKESAALTFVTVLSFIPFLMLIFFIMPDIPGLNIQENLQEVFLSVLLPDSVETGTTYVSEILEQRGPSNIFNVILLIITSFSLFRVINGTFDKILNVKELKSRSIIYKIAKFIAMIFFGFIFVVVIFSSTSASLISQIFNFPFVQRISFIIIPFMMFFLVNLFIYFFASTIKVKTGSLLIGSSVAAFIWIIVKIGFDFYIANLTNMEVVYGVIATLPIFLFWIYLNWFIVLLGVVIIAVIENKGAVLLS